MQNNIIKPDRLFISRNFPKRTPNSNKGTYGTVLNIAGSIYYPGAAYLSSIAALKSGCGLVRLAAETNVIASVSSMTPDITYIHLGQNEYGVIPKDSFKVIKDLKNISCVSIGCGLTTSPSVKDFMLNFLKHFKLSQIPVIYDADALNIISGENKKMFSPNSVITPHPAELARLMGVSADEIQSDRIKWAKNASSAFNTIVVLKGYNTVISTPDGKIYINSTGNSALSHGGTGDILTGMIAGLCAQGVIPEIACVIGVYLHGRAGEIASVRLGEFSSTASDILTFIPQAIKEFC